MAAVLKKLTKAEQEIFLKLMLRKEATEPAFKEVLRGAPKPTVPVDAVQATLDERGSRYGDFTDHARLAQQLQHNLEDHVLLNQHGLAYHPWIHLRPYQQRALTTIVDKLARILNGDPNYADNWHDIQGYAKLVEDRIIQVNQTRITEVSNSINSD